jgi:hypothetical protein
MWEESFAEELVGKDANLGKAPYGSSHFKIQKTVESMCVRVLLLDDPLREECVRDFHVLEPVQGCTAVEVFMSKHMYLAPSVLSTLFHMNFEVVRLALRVDSSSG